MKIEIFTINIISKEEEYTRNNFGIKQLIPKLIAETNKNCLENQCYSYSFALTDIFHNI